MRKQNLPPNPKPIKSTTITGKPSSPLLLPERISEVKQECEENRKKRKRKEIERNGREREPPWGLCWSGTCTQFSVASLFLHQLPNAPWRDLAVAPTWASSPQPRFPPTTPFRDSLQGLRTATTTRVNGNCKWVRALQNTFAKCCWSPDNKPDGRTGLASDPKLSGPASGSPAETRATNFASRRISILRWLYDFIDIFWYLLGCKIITTK